MLGRNWGGMRNTKKEVGVKSPETLLFSRFVLSVHDGNFFFLVSGVLFFPLGLLLFTG